MAEECVLDPHTNLHFPFSTNAKERSWGCGGCAAADEAEAGAAGARAGLPDAAGAAGGTAEAVGAGVGANGGAAGDDAGSGNDADESCRSDCNCISTVAMSSLAFFAAISFSFASYEDLRAASEDA